MRWVGHTVEMRKCLSTYQKWNVNIVINQLPVEPSYWLFQISLVTWHLTHCSNLTFPSVVWQILIHYVLLLCRRNCITIMFYRCVSDAFHTAQGSSYYPQQRQVCSSCCHPLYSARDIYFWSCVHPSCNKLL
jgi:hypothetical protein